MSVDLESGRVNGVDIARTASSVRGAFSTPHPHRFIVPANEHFPCLREGVSNG